MNDQRYIAFVQVKKNEYPSQVPFRPSKKYPEISNDDISKEKNFVYDAVRESFHLMGYDADHYGTPEWNPLGKFINNGNTVLIKPNMVMHHNNSGQGELCLYTHPSIVAAVIDYCLIALKGKGKIIVGDAPVQSCDFNILITESGYEAMVQYYKNRGINIELLDFRSQVSEKRNKRIIHKDSNDGIVVDLGEKSKFYSVSSSNHEYRVTCYDTQYMKESHHDSVHKYLIHKAVLEADVVINMPKPKSHRKAGLTASMKNLIGVNCRKDYLPHHTMGSTREGGDEYLNKSLLKGWNSRILDVINKAIDEGKYSKAMLFRFLSKACSFLSKVGKDDFYEGSWYGNHTISKTIADISSIVKYVDRYGNITDMQQRKVIIIADMIICGEKEGPLLPSSKEVGFVAVSDDMWAFDEAVCLLMGFDPCRIPTFEEAEANVRNNKGWYIVSNEDELNGKNKEALRIEPLFRFEPSSGWKGHVELP